MTKLCDCVWNLYYLAKELTIWISTRSPRCRNQHQATAVRAPAGCRQILAWHRDVDVAWFRRGSPGERRVYRHRNFLHVTCLSKVSRVEAGPNMTRTPTAARVCLPDTMIQEHVCFWRLVGWFNWHLLPKMKPSFNGVFSKIGLVDEWRFLHPFSFFFFVMGSVTSALTRTRNALVKVGSEPENHDPERSQSAPESDRSRKKSARFNVPSPAARQSSRPSLSEVLSRAESDGAKQISQKKTSDSQLKCESNIFP